MKDEPPITNHVVRDVVLDLSRSGTRNLGFSLVGGCNKKLSQGPQIDGVYIKRIFPKGLANKSGTLFSGDEILEINEESIRGKNHREVAEIIKRLKADPIIKFKVRTMVLNLSVLRKDIGKNNKVEGCNGMGKIKMSSVDGLLFGKDLEEPNNFAINPVLPVGRPSNIPSNIHSVTRASGNPSTCGEKKDILVENIGSRHRTINRNSFNPTGSAGSNLNMNRFDPKDDSKSNHFETGHKLMSPFMTKGGGITKRNYSICSEESSTKELDAILLMSNYKDSTNYNITNYSDYINSLPAPNHFYRMTTTRGGNLLSDRTGPYPNMKSETTRFSRPFQKTDNSGYSHSNGHGSILGNGAIIQSNNSPKWDSNFDQRRDKANLNSELLDRIPTHSLSISRSIRNNIPAVSLHLNSHHVSVGKKCLTDANPDHFNRSSLKIEKFGHVNLSTHIPNLQKFLEFSKPYDPPYIFDGSSLIYSKSQKNIAPFITTAIHRTSTTHDKIVTARLVISSNYGTVAPFHSISMSYTTSQRKDTLSNDTSHSHHVLAACKLNGQANDTGDKRLASKQPSPKVNGTFHTNYYKENSVDTEYNVPQHKISATITSLNFNQSNVALRAKTNPSIVNQVDSEVALPKVNSLIAMFSKVSSTSTRLTHSNSRDTLLDFNKSKSLTGLNPHPSFAKNGLPILHTISNAHTKLSPYQVNMGKPSHKPSKIDLFDNGDKLHTHSKYYDCLHPVPNKGNPSHVPSDEYYSLTESHVYSSSYSSTRTDLAVIDPSPVVSNSLSFPAAAGIIEVYDDTQFGLAGLRKKKSSDVFDGGSVLTYAHEANISSYNQRSESHRAIMSNNLASSISKSNALNNGEKSWPNDILSGPGPPTSGRVENVCLEEFSRPKGDLNGNKRNEYNRYGLSAIKKSMGQIRVQSESTETLRPAFDQCSTTMTSPLPDENYEPYKGSDSRFTNSPSNLLTRNQQHPFPESFSENGSSVSDSFESRSENLATSTPFRNRVRGKGVSDNGCKTKMVLNLLPDPTLSPNPPKDAKIVPSSSYLDATDPTNVYESYSHHVTSLPTTPTSDAEDKIRPRADDRCKRPWDNKTASTPISSLISRFQNINICDTSPHLPPTHRPNNVPSQRFPIPKGPISTNARGIRPKTLTASTTYYHDDEVAEDRLNYAPRPKTNGALYDEVSGLRIVDGYYDGPRTHDHLPALYRHNKMAEREDEEDCDEYGNPRFHRLTHDYDHVRQTSEDSTTSLSSLILLVATTASSSPHSAHGSISNDPPDPFPNEDDEDSHGSHFVRDARRTLIPVRQKNDSSGITRSFESHSSSSVSSPSPPTTPPPDHDDARCDDDVDDDVAAAESVTDPLLLLATDDSDALTLGIGLTMEDDDEDISETRDFSSLHRSRGTLDSAPPAPVGISSFSDVASPSHGVGVEDNLLIVPPTPSSPSSSPSTAATNSLNNSTASAAAVINYVCGVSTLSRFTRSESRGSIASLTSVVSLASSTSYLSPYELQQLIDEANQSLDESGTSDHEIQVVILHREHHGSGIGVTLAGGIDQEQKEVRIHKIIVGSVADRDGRARKGDRVLSINGKALKNLTHRHSVEVLKAPRPEVVLVLARPKGGGDECSSLISTNSATSSSDYGGSGCKASLSEYTNRPTMNLLEGGNDSANTETANEGTTTSTQNIFNIALDNQGPSGLGFSLEGGRASLAGDKALTVKRIFKGGASDCSGAIFPGDEIVEINDKEMRGLTHFEAWKYIKSLPEGKVNLLILSAQPQTTTTTDQTTTGPSVSS